MHSKEDHTAVDQSKQAASNMKEKEIVAKKSENVPDLSHHDDGNKQLSKEDAVDGDIFDIKEDRHLLLLEKNLQPFLFLLVDSELDTSAYLGLKTSFVGKKKLSSEDDKGNESTGSKLFQHGYTAVSDSDVKGSAMHLKEVPSAVAQSKKMLPISKQNK